MLSLDLGRTIIGQRFTEFTLKIFEKMLFLDDKQGQKITNNLFQHKSKVPQAEICSNMAHEGFSKRQV